MPHIAFVTYQQHAELQEDDSLTAEILRRAGVEVSATPWDDPTIEWNDYDLIILRSCWDYPERPDEFLAWVQKMREIKTPLLNHPEIIRWNSHKSYLIELANRGFSVVPGFCLYQEEYLSKKQTNIRTTLESHAWDTFIVKPAIGASGKSIFKFTRENLNELEDCLSELVSKGDVIVQKFIPGIMDDGEWSLIFFNKTFSHACLKQPQSGDFRSNPEYGGKAEAATPSTELIIEAQKVVDSVESDLLYTRVDAVLDGNTFRLMELELIEPSLFLSSNEKAPERFADAIMGFLS